MKIDLLKGDCLELMKGIPDGSVDMCLTDPPYGTTACKWDTIIDLKSMWSELNRIIKDNGAICLFGAEPFSSILRNSNIKEFRYDWVWMKSRVTGHLNAKRRPMTEHEIISVFKERTYNPITDKIEPKTMQNSASDLRRNKDNVTSTVSGGLKKEYIQSETNYPRSILKFKSEGKPVHPTQKPVALLEYLIKTYTLEGETVLDFTMGSGSTGVAAKNLNRSFIGIEQDDKYFEVAKERIGVVESIEIAKETTNEKYVGF